MKIMGLRDWAHQLGWFLSAFFLFFWIAISFTYITSKSFLLKSDSFLLFLFFFLLCMSEINFAFFVSVFFSNSKLASIVAPVALFGALMPRYAFTQTNSNEQVVAKVFASLLSPTAFSFGADIIANLEYTGVGLQFSNISDGDFNFALVLFMMWLDFYIYGFLAWYLDQVLPQEYGTPKGEVSYEVQSATYLSLPEFRSVSSDSDIEGDLNSDLTKSVERLPSDLYPKVKVYVQGLQKRYPDGKLAVKNLSMLLLEDQITCLLGHNGAGKTTTISTLTGLVEATAGTVMIYGRSLKTDLQAIRQMTGVCPQHNVLFYSLTVQEHLFFFGKVKGLTGIHLRNAVDRVLVEVGLTEKRHVLASALSGGMKRKLSLCIALVGDPKFVLLDEPTSGFTQCSVRDGSVQSTNRFGAGYLLSISKVRPEVSVEKIETNVKAIVSAAKVNSAVAGEVIMHLPLDSIGLFPALFSMLKVSREDLGIGSYGISITTLESVFISLAKTTRTEDEEFDEHDQDLSTVDYGIRYVRTAFIYAWLMCGLVVAHFWMACCSGKTYLVLRPSAVLEGNENEFHSRKSALGDVELTDSKVIKKAEVIGGVEETSRIDLEMAVNVEAIYNEEKKADDICTNPIQVVKTDVPLSQMALKGSTASLLCIQIVELFRKRLIIASRDLKGFFFQVLFPAIQIMLVLLILTINVNPAGHTITLNASLFHKKASLTPLVDFAGTFSSPVTEMIATDVTVAVGYVAAPNSTQLVPVNVTVDWNWVRRTIKSLSVSDVVVNIKKVKEDITATFDAGSMLSLSQVYSGSPYSKYTVMHNSTSPHGMAGFAGEITAAVFKSCTPAGLDSIYLSKNHPLPITPKTTIDIQVILALLTSIFILVPLCYIPASFVSFIPVAFVSSAESSSALFLLLLTYGASSIALSYLYSLAFDNFSTAQISIMAINFFTGFVFVLAYYIMISVPETHELGTQLVNFFRFFPPYNIGEGLINLSTNYYVNTILHSQISFFSWNVAGRSIVFMAAEALGYFTIILITEFTPLHNLSNSVSRRISQLYLPVDKRNGYGLGSTASSDVDVQAEADLIDAVENPSSSEFSLLIRHLGKMYPPSIIGGTVKYAVKNISLGCKNGERFGLLGINGAGKTTTLSILTGDIQQTYGDVFIGEESIIRDPKTRQMIGYCPQVDPLLDLMNGYETLFFFGRIRVQELLKEVGLMKFAHKPCGTYSGGNKRKLSLAVALIGDPAVLFLDEPST
eukprot:gene18774-19080_t